MSGISESVREEAIEFLLVMDDVDIGFGEGRDQFAPSDAAFEAAHVAWTAVYEGPRWTEWTSRDIWPEAAALLRDGWCPGDPVRLLKGGAK